MPLAIIRTETGRLVTVVRDDVPAGWTPPDGCTAIPSDQLPADIERETQVEPVPDRITPRQLRLWLLSVGIPLNVIEGKLETDEARVEWEYAQEILREHSLVLQLAEALDMTAADVDQAFREASTL